MENLQDLRKKVLQYAAERNIEAGAIVEALQASSPVRLHDVVANWLLDSVQPESSECLTLYDLISTWIVEHGRPVPDPTKWPKRRASIKLRAKSLHPPGTGHGETRDRDNVATIYKSGSVLSIAGVGDDLRMNRQSLDDVQRVRQRRLPNKLRFKFSRAPAVPKCVAPDCKDLVTCAASMVALAAGGSALAVSPIDLFLSGKHQQQQARHAPFPSAPRKRARVVDELSVGECTLYTPWSPSVLGVPAAAYQAALPKPLVASLGAPPGLAVPYKPHKPSWLVLIDISIDLGEEALRVKDSLLWDIYEDGITPLQFATAMANDLGLPLDMAPMIANSMAVQLAAFTMSITPQFAVQQRSLRAELDRMLPAAFCCYLSRRVLSNQPDVTCNHAEQHLIRVPPISGLLQQALLPQHCSDRADNNGPAFRYSNDAVLKCSGVTTSRNEDDDISERVMGGYYGYVPLARRSTPWIPIIHPLDIVRAYINAPTLDLSAVHPTVIASAASVRPALSVSRLSSLGIPVALDISLHIDGIHHTFKDHLVIDLAELVRAMDATCGPLAAGFPRPCDANLLHSIAAATVADEGLRPEFLPAILASFYKSINEFIGAVVDLDYDVIRGIMGAGN